MSDLTRGSIGRTLAAVRRSIWILGLTLAVIAPAALALTPQDQRAAYRAQARLTDLPPGWRTAQGTVSQDKTCLDTSRIAKPTGKSYREFAEGQFAQMLSSVALFRTATQARKVYAAITGDKPWTCFADLLKKETHAEEVKFGRYLVRGVPARTNAHEVLVSYKANGVSITLYVHGIVARKGRALLYVVPIDAFSPALTLDEETTLLRRMVSRLPGG
jgi:hypothetical protein